MRIILLMLAAANVQAMTLDDYLHEVAKKNKLLSSYELSVEASNDRREAGDLLLSPLLTASYSVTSDQSLPSTVADQRDTTAAAIGLSKKFSTGTQVSLSANTFKYEYELPAVPGNTGYSKGGVGIAVMQSLWKDFFGAATRLRHVRESDTNRLETLNLDLRRRVANIEFESDFWDYIVASEDKRLKQDNFDRAKKLEKWTANRVSNGISDDTDLLQVKALSARRELELAAVNDDLLARELKIRQNLDLAESAPFPELTANLADTRPYISELAKQKNIIKIDSYLAELEAKVRKTSSEEVTDSLRPDLSVTGQYNTSSYDVDHGTMTDNITKTDRPITYVGVNFSWFFGSDAKSAQLSSAKKEAMAAQLRAEQARVNGVDAWNEYLRKYEVAKENVLTLERIAKLQSDRSKSEQQKFSKGRTITTNVLNAITDSAEAEVSYLRARSGLRKLEAGTLLFKSIAE